MYSITVATLFAAALAVAVPLEQPHVVDARPNQEREISARNRYEEGIIVYPTLGCSGPAYGDLNHDEHSGNNILNTGSIGSAVVKNDGSHVGVGCITVYEDVNCDINYGRIRNYNMYKQQCISFNDAGFTARCIVVGTGDGTTCDSQQQGPAAHPN